jgi:hypothetical protein
MAVSQEVANVSLHLAAQAHHPGQVCHDGLSSVHWVKRSVAILGVLWDRFGV